MAVVEVLSLFSVFFSVFKRAMWKYTTTFRLFMTETFHFREVFDTECEHKDSPLRLCENNVTRARYQEKI